MAVSDVMAVRLVCVAPKATVADAIDAMMEAGVGAVAVCEEARLVGILTERDVLRLASEGAQFDRIRVERAMTVPVVTISPDDDAVSAARIMGERGIRHLPVVQAGNVLGMVGIRDVLGVLAERLWRMHDQEAHDTVGALLRKR
jgi:CBS domain-containing protein